MNEEMKGWKELVIALPKHLEGALADQTWWRQVAFPAFETNETEIFRRKI